MIFPPSKLWKANFFTLCDVILQVRRQGKLEIDHSWKWTGYSMRANPEKQHFIICNALVFSVGLNCMWYRLSASQRTSKIMLSAFEVKCGEITVNTWSTRWRYRLDWRVSKLSRISVNTSTQWGSPGKYSPSAHTTLTICQLTEVGHQTLNVNVWRLVQFRRDTATLVKTLHT